MSFIVVQLRLYLILGPRKSLKIKKSVLSFSYIITAITIAITILFIKQKYSLLSSYLHMDTLPACRPECNRKSIPDMARELHEDGSQPCKGTSGFIMESVQAPLINTT